MDLIPKPRRPVINCQVADQVHRTQAPRHSKARTNDDDSWNRFCGAMENPTSSVAVASTSTLPSHDSSLQSVGDTWRAINLIGSVSSSNQLSLDETTRQIQGQHNSTISLPSRRAGKQLTSHRQKSNCSQFINAFHVAEIEITPEGTQADLPR
jgi:hypothetical protein